VQTTPPENNQYNKKGVKEQGLTLAAIGGGVAGLVFLIVIVILVVVLLLLIYFTIEILICIPESI